MRIDSREDPAMRRSISAVSVGSFVIVIAVFIAIWNASSGTALSNLFQDAPPPVTTHDIPGIAVTDTGTLPLTPAPTVGPGTPEPEYTLRLKRVDLWLGAVTSEGHAHDGSFVLFVDTGAVCYTLLDPVESGTVVKATVPEHVEPPVPCPAPELSCGPEACAPPRTDCDGGAGCTLEPGDTVYLPTGSTITQVGDGAWHWYGNVDPDHPAVVYLAEYQLEVDGAPGCSGGCH
jgi:hypothetical protein